MTRELEERLLERQTAQVQFDREPEAGLGAPCEEPDVEPGRQQGAQSSRSGLSGGLS